MPVMTIMLQLVILTLSLLLVNADDELLNHFTTNPSIVPVKSCCDLWIYAPARVPSGVYKMSMGTFGTANVYCDMTTADGRWIVIQRNRMDSPVSFNRNWREYENGFGDMTTEFWYGIKAIHTLTQSGQWEMRVDYKKVDNSSTYIHYNQFKVTSASEEYKLILGAYTGVDGNHFTTGNEPANNMMFSTFDNDNDQWSSGNCGASWMNGWWFDGCFDINPNVQPPFYNHPNVAVDIEIKIRQTNCI